jgi:hypothetical protein
VNGQCVAITTPAIPSATATTAAAILIQRALIEKSKLSLSSFLDFYHYRRFGSPNTVFRYSFRAPSLPLNARARVRPTRANGDVLPL